MTALAGDINGEAALGRHHRAGTDAHLAHGNIRHDMEGDKGIRGIFLEYSRSQDFQSALAMVQIAGKRKTCHNYILLFEK